MPQWGKVTPALYAITRKVAAPVIRERWDNLVVPVLNKEGSIYERALDTYAFVYSLSHNSASALEIFVTILKHDGITFDQDTLPSALFDVYWDIAENNQYWNAGNYAQIGGRIPYDRALQQWEANNPERIKWCEDNLQQWLNAN